MRIVWFRILFELDDIEYNIYHIVVMNLYDEQCLKVKQAMLANLTLQEFQNRLVRESHSHNTLYLGLLSMHIVRSSSPTTVDYLKILIKHGLNPNFTEPKTPTITLSSNPSLFLLACQNSSAPVIKLFLSFEELDVGYEDANGENALFYAVRNRSVEESKEIIHLILTDFPYLVHSVAKSSKKSLLCCAIDQKSIPLAEILLKKGADPNYQSQITGNRILHELLQNSNALSFQLQSSFLALLLIYNADANLANFQGQTAFDVADTYLFDLEGLLMEASKVKKQKEELFSLKIESQSMNAVTKDQQIRSEQENSLDSLSSLEEQSEEQRDRIQNLEREIWENSFKCQAIYEDTWKDIAKLYEQLTLIGQKFSLELQFIGSFATGLWTPFSDIDFAFINHQKSYVDISNILRLIYQIISKRLKQLGIYQIYLNDSLKFPNIKIELCKKLRCRKIDITIFQMKNTARKYVHFIKQSLKSYPLIKPTFFALHSLLETFDLHRPTKNGLKTYTIFLMIFHLVQNYQSENVGYFLKDIIAYYADTFPYEENLSKTGDYLLKFNIFDPLNFSNNAGGKETNVEEMRKMFKALNIGIKMTSSKQVLPFLLQIFHIFSK